MIAVFATLAQLIGTMYNICKIRGSNPDIPKCYHKTIKYMQESRYLIVLNQIYQPFYGQFLLIINKQK